jgi:hypothetical protein
MRIQVDFKYKNIINKIENDFPFFTVYRVMDVTGWQYFDSPNTPTIEKIKNTLFRLVNDVKDDFTLGTGGFDVNYKNNNYNITFTVASFFFSEKSERWDYETMENLTDLIKTVELTEVIFNSALMMLKNNEKYLFFRRVCNEFIESGSDYKYDKKLGLLFTKEIDVDTLYTLHFIGVDKDFTL